MNRILIILATALACTFSAAGKKPNEPQAPEWVKMKPAVSGYYVGVGSASVSTKDYREKAKEKALADMTSDIELKIASQSLFERLDQNGDYSETYRNDIRSESSAWLEGYELADTYSDGKNYYVQYRLSKADFDRIRRERVKKATTIAGDYLHKGRAAHSAGRVLDAVELYVAGIKAIEPYGNERPEATVDGNTVNLASELIYSLTGLFSRLELIPTPEEVTVTPFQREVIPVKILVRSDGRPATGMKLKARFSNGDGNISVSDRTDADGSTDIIMREISAKPQHRDLVVSTDMDMASVFDTPATEALGKRIFSSLQPLYIPVNLEDNDLKAIIYTTDHDSSSLLRFLSGYFSSNYFDMVDQSCDADLNIIVSTRIRNGGIVHGQLYDMREYFTSCTVSIEDLNAPSHPEVARVTIDDFRTLSPVSTSATAARASAQREMFKRISKQLDKRLAEAKFARRTPSDSQPTDDETPDDDTPSDF